MLKQYVGAYEISIHTPTRGVTGVSVKESFFIDISIHTPTRGVTNLLHTCGYLQQIFQSTLPQGE